MKTEEEFIKEMKSGVNNILVAVRVRPLWESENLKETKSIVETLDNNLLILLDPSSNVENYNNRSKEKHFAFDIVFNQEATQQQVFRSTTEFLLEGVVNGYNASVFAYGPSGAGKTYTMVGEPDKPGVMLNTFLNLFSKVELLSRDREYKVNLSYLEIYNENIRDLLNPGKEGLDIREDPQRGMIVAGLSEILASSTKAVFACIRNGNRRRTCEPTKANQTSSRSHAILQITVEYRDKALGTQSEIIIGKLSLIDLAGSERAANTRNRGLRLIEGANINKSLLSLGNCINALCELNEKGGKIHVPYRDSKLTRLLKDSLGGNCRTVMIACISPSHSAYEDTHNTLIYANRAKNIKTKVERNSLNVQYHISRYTSIINQLKQEITNLRSQLGSIVPTNPHIEHFLIDISRHFQEEASLRKLIYLNEQKKDNIGFSLFAKQIELIELSIEKGDNSSFYQKAKEEIDEIKKNSNFLELEVQKYRERLEILEKQRENIENQWYEFGITEPYISHLALEMKKHSLLMNSLDFEGKETHNKLVIEQKDMYIKLLEEQLKLRDSLIEAELPQLDNKFLKKIKSFDQINSHFFVSQSVSNSPSKKSAKILPFIKRTRIPQPKNSESFFIEEKKDEDSIKNQIISMKKDLQTIKKESYVIKKEGNIMKKDNSKGNELKYSNKYKHRLRAYSVESRFTDSSGTSTYSENKIRVPNISDKYSNSPYVKSRLKNNQAKFTN